MPKTKVLITVKTYPTLSSKYDELVCTAGFREDGSWVRIYPVPYRKLDSKDQYSLWEWIEIDLDPNHKDFRHESFRPHDIEEGIHIIGNVDTKYEWTNRKALALKKVWTNMTDLIAEAKDPKHYTSLAVLKPKEIIGFKCKEVEGEWDKKKLKHLYEKQKELSLFEQEDTKSMFKLVRKVPYKFSYIFKTDDGKKRTLMIENWEIGALYWRMFKKYHDKKIACDKVKEKYFDDFAKTKDLYFFVGTNFSLHLKSSDPFMIIGTFTPPKTDPTLF